MRLFKCLTRERGISEGQKGNSNSLCGPLIECGPLTVGAKKKRIKREIEVSDRYSYPSMGVRVIPTGENRAVAGLKKEKRIILFH